MAECALNRWGNGRFRGFSAGSHPKGVVHPLTLELLGDLGYETGKLRSKSWDEFAATDSPRIDFVFTLCDQAAAECPVLPGRAVTAHWGGADLPEAFEGTEEEKRRFFAHTYRVLENRVKLFLDLYLDRFDRASLQQPLKEIGHTTFSEPTWQLRQRRFQRVTGDSSHECHNDDGPDLGFASALVS
jgi:arsenate reductase